MLEWFRGDMWWQPVIRTIAVGGYLVGVSWLTHRLADGLARRTRPSLEDGG